MISTASDKLSELTDSSCRQSSNHMELPVQPTIFDLLVTPPSPVLDKLSDIQPDDLSPREALELLYELKQLQEDSTKKSE